MFRPPCILPIWNILPLELLPDITDSQILLKLLKRVSDLTEKVIQLQESNNQNAEAITELQQECQAIKTELDKIRNGDYVYLYLDSIIYWINANLQNLVANIVKYIFFGLTDDGYFAAYIPDSWDFVTFDTGFDPNDTQTFGHLILKY